MRIYTPHEDLGIQTHLDDRIGCGDPSPATDMGTPMGWLACTKLSLHDDDHAAQGIDGLVIATWKQSE